MSKGDQCCSFGWAIIHCSPFRVTSSMTLDRVTWWFLTFFFFAQRQVSLATVIFVASQKALSAEVKAVIKQQLESVSNGWTVYRIARQASRMVCVLLPCELGWWRCRVTNLRPCARRSWSKLKIEMEVLLVIGLKDDGLWKDLVFNVDT